jgi:hypothetical protein
VVAGGAARGGGRGGARRRSRSVLSASPRRAAARNREGKRGKVIGREGSGGETLLELVLDLAGLRETAQLSLREDQVVADGDLEDAATTADQLGGDAELAFDLSRQTGGAGVVVSAGAVLDGDRPDGDRPGGDGTVGDGARGHTLLLSPPSYQPATRRIRHAGGASAERNETVEGYVGMCKGAA